VTLVLVPGSLERIKTLAKCKNKTVEDEAAYLLEKAIGICETTETPGKPGVTGKEGRR